MTQIILTTLGTGNYSPATYQWGTRTPLKSVLFSAALSRWLPQAAIHVLMTKEAREKNKNLLDEAFSEYVAVEIYKGSSDAENWAQFEAIVNTIPAGSTVYMDVTHGFRSLPIVTLLALAYLRSVRGVSIAGVLYGAWEPGRSEEEITPVFDLTPFVSMLDWASASERFIDTGDARRIVKLLSGQEGLKEVTAPIEALSSALASQRPAEASRAAQQLRKEVKKIKRKPLRQEQQQFALALEHIEERFEGIAHSDEAYADFPERVLKGQYRQIQFYLRGGQYSQAIALTREWLLSIRLWKAERNPIWESAGRTESRVNQLPSLAGKSEWAEFQALWIQVLPLRNRFAHFHTDVSRNPVTSDIDIKDVQEFIAQLPAAVLPLGLDLHADSA